MDETDGLRDTGEREAAAGSIDEGYGEFSEFIDRSSIDLTRYRTRSNAHKSCQVCFCPRRSFRADAGCLLSKEASPRLRLRPLPVDLSLLDLFGPGRSTGSQPATVRCHVTGKRSRPAAVRCQSLSRWVPASGRNLRPSTSTPTTAFQPQQQQHLAQQLSTPKNPHPPTLYGFLCAYDGRVCLPVSQG